MNLPLFGTILSQAMMQKMAPIYIYIGFSSALFSDVQQVVLEL